MGMGLLSKLPKDFLVALMSQWLGLHGTVILDSAMSCAEGRVLLLEALSSGNVIFPGSTSASADDELPREARDWIVRKGVGLRGCSLRADFTVKLSDVDALVAIAGNSKMHLKALYMKNFSCSFENKMTQIVTRCPNIEVLNFYFCDGIGNFAVVAAAKQLRHHLKEIHLHRCDAITDTSLYALSGCPNLVLVDLYWCSKVGNKGIRALAEACPLIERLNLYKLNKLTDESITAIANGCKNLKVLDISDCVRVTDVSISLLASQCPQLTQLHIWNCTKLTDASIKAVATMCLHLRFIDFSWCKLVTDEAVLC